MGVDTRGLLKGDISAEEILNFIRHNYDKNAKSYVTDKDYGSLKEVLFNEKYGDRDNWIVKYGNIDFSYKGEDRSLFYYKSNINYYENLKYYSEYGLENMVKSETTSISLGCWGNSVQIIKDIVREFGGWIDENDCDDISYYLIEKDSKGDIKPVIYVTMEDIYEKFGGIVVINK
jgi:hypothetical protein